VVAGDAAAATAAATALTANPIFLAVNIGLTVLQNLLVAGGATAGYLLFSEEKKAGDTGGFPGFFSPNHPDTAVKALFAPRDESFAMAY
jgi:hypothetical protein